MPNNGNGRTALEDILADLSRMRDEWNRLELLMAENAELRPCAIGLDWIVNDSIPVVDRLHETVHTHYDDLMTILEATGYTPAQLQRYVRGE